MKAKIQAANFLLLLGSLCAGLNSSDARADESMRLGIPTYQGTGCPEGSASATMTADGTQLSILFDRYTAEAGGNTGRRNERKSCSLSIPVEIPSNVSVAIVEVDYRGYHSLPTRGYSELSVNYSLGPLSGPRFLRRFVGPLDTDFFAKQKLRATDVRWSACGGRSTLHLNTSMIVVSNGQQELSLAALDSADLHSGFTYVVQYRPCR
jgi:hypothetical protein